MSTSASVQVCTYALIGISKDTPADVHKRSHNNTANQSGHKLRQRLLRLRPLRPRHQVVAAERCVTTIATPSITPPTITLPPKPRRSTEYPASAWHDDLDTRHCQRHLPTRLVRHRDPLRAIDIVRGSRRGAIRSRDACTRSGQRRRGSEPTISCANPQLRSLLERSLTAIHALLTARATHPSRVPKRSGILVSCTGPRTQPQQGRNLWEPASVATQQQLELTKCHGTGAVLIPPSPSPLQLPRRIRIHRGIYRSSQLCGDLRRHQRPTQRTCTPVSSSSSRAAA